MKGVYYSLNSIRRLEYYKNIEDTIKSVSKNTHRSKKKKVQL